MTNDVLMKFQQSFVFNIQKSIQKTTLHYTLIEVSKSGDV